MFVAKVTGALVATQKVQSMVGRKLMIVEPYRLDDQTRDRLHSTGRTMVAVDLLGAGIGDYVLITQGSSSRMTPQTKDTPVDTVIVGIVDKVHVESVCVYARESNGSPS